MAMRYNPQTGQWEWYPDGSVEADTIDGTPIPFKKPTKEERGIEWKFDENGKPSSGIDWDTEFAEFQQEEEVRKLEEERQRREQELREQAEIERLAKAENKTVDEYLKAEDIRNNGNLLQKAWQGVQDTWGDIRRGTTNLEEDPSLTKRREEGEIIAIPEYIRKPYETEEEYQARYRSDYQLIEQAYQDTTTKIERYRYLQTLKKDYNNLFYEADHSTNEGRTELANKKAAMLEGLTDYERGLVDEWSRPENDLKFENKVAESLTDPLTSKIENEISKLEEAQRTFNQFMGREDIDRNIVAGIKANLDSSEERQGVIPFIGTASQIDGLLTTKNLLEKIERGEELNEEEQVTLAQAQAQFIKQRLDLGVGDNIGNGIVNLGSFAVEILAGGGVSNVLKAGTKEVIGEAGETMIGKLFIQGVGLAGREAVNVLPRATQNFYERSIPRIDFVNGEDGITTMEILDGEDDFSAAWKAVAGTNVELATELIGGRLIEGVGDKGLDLFKKIVLGKATDKVAANLVKQGIPATSSKIAEVLQGMGYQGIIGEALEEELGEPLQAAIDGREYQTPILTREGTQRFIQSAIVSSIPGGFSTIVNLPSFNNKISVEAYIENNELVLDTSTPLVTAQGNDILATDPMKGKTQFDDVTDIMNPTGDVNEQTAIRQDIKKNPEAWKPILDIAANSKNYKDFATQVQAAVDSNTVKIPDVLVGSGKEMFREGADGTLVALHNLSEDSLRKNLDAGGLAAPSIAITKADAKFDSFGEITLVGKKELVTPGKDTQTRVFSGDIYSPTVGDSVQFEKVYNSNKELPEDIQQILTKVPSFDIKNYDSPIQIDSWLKGSGISQEDLKYLKDNLFRATTRVKSTATVSKELSPLLKNKAIAKLIKASTSDYDLRLQLDNNPESSAAFQEIAEDLGRGDEVYEIIDEFTNQIFEAKPATVNNIVASINQRLTIKGLDVRGSEGGWSVPARVFAYREFKTLAEIKKFEGLLTDAESASFKGEAKQAQFADFVDNQITYMEGNGIKFDNSTALYDAINSEEALAELVKGLKMLPKLSDYDTKTIEGLDSFNNDFEKTKKSNKRVTADAIRYAGYSAEASDIKKFTENLDYDDFVDKMNVTFRDLDTEYFEAKIMRAVDINEFAGAIVPDEIAPDLVTALESKGLKVAKYSYFKEGDRFKQLAEAFGDVRFRRLDEAEGALRSKLSPEDLIKIRTLNEMMFGDRNVGVVEKIITPDGMEAVGKYASNWIEIVDKQANATDTFYHESVHKAIDVFLSGEQKAELFVYGKSKYKLEGLALEEKIAEDFINYANGDKKLSIPQKITQIFKDLLSRITGFKEHTNIIESFYADLLEGNLKSNQKNIKISEQLFNTLKEINAADNLSITEQQNESNQENAVEEVDQQSNERQEETPKETVWEAAIAQKESIKSELNDGEDVVLDYVDEMRGKSFEESAVKVLEELETAQAGFRYSVEGSDGFQEWKGQKSTFPSWFSLRTRKEIDDFLTKIPDNPEIWTLDNNPFKEGTKKATAWGEFIGQLDRQTHESILEEEREAIESFLGYPVEQFTTKLDGIIKKDVEDRTTKSGQVALTKELKPKEVVAEKITSVQKRQAAQTPVEQQVGNKLRNSRVYEKLLQSVDEDLQQQPQYERMNIRENLDRAIDFVETNYAKAKRVALGLENPPANITEIAIRRAMAAKAQLDGDMGLYEQLIRSRSLRLTRLGQEIVSERGAVDQDNPEFYLQELTSRRMDIAAKQLPMPAESAARNIVSKLVKNQKISNKEKVTSYIDTETKSVKKLLEVENIKIAKAQDIIDLLTC